MIKIEDNDGDDEFSAYPGAYIEMGISTLPESDKDQSLSTQLDQSLSTQLDQSLSTQQTSTDRNDKDW